MSSEPQGWQAPKTDWTAPDTPIHTDANRWEGNAQAIETGDRTLDQTQAPNSNTGSLRQLLSWFANRIQAITGATNWYDAPATTIKTLSDKFGSSGHKHSGSAGDGPKIPPSSIEPQGAGSGLNAEFLQGLEPEDIFKYAEGSFIETTSIPNGQQYIKSVPLDRNDYKLAIVNIADNGGGTARSGALIIARRTASSSGVVSVRGQTGTTSSVQLQFLSGTIQGINNTFGVIGGGNTNIPMSGDADLELSSVHINGNKLDFAWNSTRQRSLDVRVEWSVIG